MSTGVILVAGGDGRRFGGSSPKQFCRVNGDPVYLHSLKTFLKVPSVHEIAIVTREDFLGPVKRRVSGLRSRKKLIVVVGGASRGESVRNGLRTLSADIETILVHDAARPLVTKEVIEDVAMAARKTGAAVAAVPVPDTLKMAQGSFFVKKTVPRKKMWLAQTPQGFRRDVALKCLMKPSRRATDDVQLAERKGFRVQIVPGSPTNFKVTYPHDLTLCRSLLR